MNKRIDILITGLLWSWIAIMVGAFCGSVILTVLNVLGVNYMLP